MNKKRTRVFQGTHACVFVFIMLLLQADAQYFIAINTPKGSSYIFTTISANQYIIYPTITSPLHNCPDK